MIPYPGSELIYQAILESDDPYGGQISNKILVYWTDAPLDDVQKYQFVSDDRILVYKGDGKYYISDSMSSDSFRYTTTAYSHDICAHRLDPRELTTLNLYFLTRDNLALRNQMPMSFGCGGDVKLNLSEILVRNNGIYIVLGYSI